MLTLPDRAGRMGTAARAVVGGHERGIRASRRRPLQRQAGAHRIQHVVVDQLQRLRTDERAHDDRCDHPSETEPAAIRQIQIGIVVLPPAVKIVTMTSSQESAKASSAPATSAL